MNLGGCEHSVYSRLNSVFRNTGRMKPCQMGVKTESAIRRHITVGNKDCGDKSVWIHVPVLSFLCDLGQGTLSLCISVSSSVK